MTTVASRSRGMRRRGGWVSLWVPFRRMPSFEAQDRNFMDFETPRVAHVQGTEGGIYFFERRSPRFCETVCKSVGIWKTGAGRRRERRWKGHGPARGVPFVLGSGTDVEVDLSL